ncbi:DUF4276 family protein [Porphyromonas gingivalis]|uniref:DUF4276 family protein n=1 Tax=Porphyromonas gingivalis TaxID=837 RepID=UPI000BE76755|nr:DUF4276 family protein [Porphyromonas gingivalis]MDH7904483.1 DUF4276 family protein [Porphyromonas gingivalis]PDP49228.1 hypothetical protein CLI77_06195 [Porphyromonas gingivalis]
MNKFRRLNITAEGQTEEKFVKQTLSEYLGKFNISTDVRCVMTSKDKKKCYRGGLISYKKAKRDIINWLKEDNNPEVTFTTMFDLYALPNDFPKYNDAMKYTNPYDRVHFLENAFYDDINDVRFLPYIQLHEFEALILSEPQVLQNEYFEHQNSINQLVQLLKSKKGNAELINDNPATAPSKRIIKLIPEYECNKVSVGAAIAGMIGINSLKRNCKHFKDWLDRII